MKKRILIVEDDPDILFILDMILNNEGYSVESVTLGKNILEKKYTIPDLIILDKQLPDMDGIEVCRHLKSQGETRTIPLIMVSASPSFGKLAMDAGVDDFIEKPFQMHALLDMVARYTMVRT